MTFRAVVLGVLAAVFLATVGCFNCTVPRLNPFVGNHLPVIVFFPRALIVHRQWTQRERPPYPVARMAAAVIGVLCTVFSFDLRECMMPFVLNGLRIAQLGNVPAAVPFSLWGDHNWGVKSGHGWAVNSVPRYTFDFMAGAYDELNSLRQFKGQIPK